MLRAEHLNCKYGDFEAVKDVSFSVEENDKFCILGPNGCGKTTILKAISGLMPCKGKIYLEGEDIRKIPRKEVAKKVALLTQISSVYFSYTVLETVMLGRYTHLGNGLFNSFSKADRDLVEDCLVQAGIQDLRDKPITELSGGQLQRVFLARVFAQDPDIILLDEPTNHLDLGCQLELMDQLRDWAAEKGHCVVGVLHEINLALSFANKILLLNEGETVSYGSAKDFDLDHVSRIYRADIRSHMIDSLKRWEK